MPKPTVPPAAIAHPSPTGTAPAASGATAGFEPAPGGAFLPSSLSQLPHKGPWRELHAQQPRAVGSTSSPMRLGALVTPHEVPPATAPPTPTPPCLVKSTQMRRAPLPHEQRMVGDTLREPAKSIIFFIKYTSSLGTNLKIYKHYITKCLHCNKIELQIQEKRSKLTHTHTRTHRW